VSWKKRRAALKSASTEGLIEALLDKNRFVRIEAVTRLTPRLGDEGVEAALVQRLEDRSRRVLEAVYPAIPGFGPDALPALERLVARESIPMLVLVAPYLATLAETRPHPRQKLLADGLKKRAREWFIPLASRRALKEAAERIAWAIFPLRDLPIAAGEPVPGSAKDLPIPWWKRPIV
jgi:hypothetical protein